MAVNGTSEGPTKVPILGKESIIIEYGLWQNYVAKDLLHNIPSTNYALVTDTTIGKLFVPVFQKAFEKEAAQLSNLSLIHI